jgi:hypothetical protein
MSYQLNKTDGTLLTDLIDGQIDSNSTNLVLVGRNYTGFGEFLNENFIKLLENFANSAAPTNPLEGQLWWDKAEARLKLWDGSQWKASGGPFVQATRPQMVAGDLWIDNLNKQFYFYDGTDLILVGPPYNSFQGTTGFIVDSILDNQSRSRAVAKLYVGGEADENLVAVVSNVEFTPTYSQRIIGLVTDDNPNGIIKEGFNIIDTANFKFFGTATASESLVDEAGNVVTANQFLPSDKNGITVGTLTVQNSGGLTIGLSQNNVQKVLGSAFLIENQLRDHNLRLRVRSTARASLITDAIFIKADTAHVGIFRDDPEYTLDVAGDLRVTGDLLVEGNTVSVDVATLRVEDKAIELGITSDSTLLSDAAMDGAGIIARVTGDDKTLTWVLSTDAWTSNRNFDLSATDKTYKIAGVNKITNTTIDSSITQATGLVEIGTLQYLNVDTININNSTIATTSGTSLTLNSTGGAINLQTQQKITNLADPTANQDAATKIYVDTQISSEPVVFSLDITGLATPDTQIPLILESMFPAATKQNGTYAFIHTTESSASTAENIDVDAAKNISFVAVDSNGTQNESVVQDIAFFPASGTVNITISRGLKRFEVQAGAWVFDTNLATGL